MARRRHKFSKTRRVVGNGGRFYRYCMRCRRRKVGPVPNSRCRRPQRRVAA